MKRNLFVIAAIAALTPLATANAAQDCRDDPFYTLKQINGEFLNCTFLSPGERETARKQRGAEGTIGSERPTDGAARGQIEWEREAEKWKSLGNTYTN